jgi:hypothetical protein
VDDALTVPAALVRMTVAERERYVRWWIEESGLTPTELREVAGAVWVDESPHSKVVGRRVRPPGEVTRRRW